MRITMFFVLAALTGLLIFRWTTQTGAAEKQPGKARPFGIEKRIPWTTSRIKGTPDPPKPYRIQRAFPKLKFAEPLDMTRIPGTDRLVVAERYGKIFSFADDPKTAKAELLLDLGKVVYGVALHPKFKQNGYLYVTYIIDPEKEQPHGTHLSRFQANRDTFRCDPKTEKLLIEWPSGGHNGGCLKFGPDGFLYVATGDSSGIADEKLTGQDLSTLAGSILRIDVDHPDEGKPYGIPKDNPFVGTAGARPEIWAYGLRQVWKMSFDQATGQLWGGNVGQDLWEMIFILKSGGNYGWSVTEGSYPFRPERKRGPTPIIPPIIEYNHTEGRSVTGGFVYHGKRLNKLAGAYIYGDYDTGRVWALRYDGQKVTRNEELVDTSIRLVGFGETRDGELYLVDHMGGGLHRLVPNDQAQDPADFPRKLSQTGLFASTAKQTPAAGVIGYSVVAPAWSDGAVKQWYLAVPGRSQIEFETLTYPQPAPGAPPGWKFPHGTVLAETISLEMEQGNPASRRRLETRILHHERIAGSEQFGDQYWRGYTYLWNKQQTDAVLLEDPNGLDRTYTIRDAAAPGGKRQQTWHFPSRAECTVCHNMAAKYAIGVTTLQMNKDHDYGGVIDNQLRTLEHINLFTEPLPKPPDKLPRLVDYSDSKQNLDRRARSYLHANCGHCHRKWGGGNAEFQLVHPLKLDETGTLGVRPGQGTFAIPHARLLSAGDPYRSVLFYRVAKLGSGRMPRIGSNVVDEAGLRLIHDWIAALPSDSESRTETVSAIKRLRASGGSPAADRLKQIDALLGSTGASLQLAWTVGDAAFPESIRNEILARVTTKSPAHIRDLFERFLPEEQRTKRLGTVIKPETILALPGNVERGRKFFLETEGVQCKNCHKIRDKGTEIGPDLSEIGKKYTRAQLLEEILEPSKKVDPKFMTYVLETAAGRIHSGLLVKKTTDEVVLKNGENKLITLPTDDIELLVPQQRSLMPDLLLRDMTAQQVADLTAYLNSLK